MCGTGDWWRWGAFVVGICECAAAPILLEVVGVVSFGYVSTGLCRCGHRSTSHGESQIRDAKPQSSSSWYGGWFPQSIWRSAVPNIDRNHCSELSANIRPSVWAQLILTHPDQQKWARMHKKHIEQQNKVGWWSQMIQEYEFPSLGIIITNVPSIFCSAHSPSVNTTISCNSILAHPYYLFPTVCLRLTKNVFTCSNKNFQVTDLLDVPRKLETIILRK